jgi:hypothetical protein
MTLDPAKYPNLLAEGYTQRSPVDRKYNCIAWAAGENNRFWWYTLGYYWPAGAPRANSIAALVKAFATLGYLECNDNECINPAYEPVFDRIAIYALLGDPKHAARQIDARLWTSKMGQNIDIETTLRALEGPYYGRVVKILKRPK